LPPPLHEKVRFVLARSGAAAIVRPAWVFRPPSRPHRITVEEKGMQGAGRRLGPACLAAVALLAGLACPAWADDTEHRDFVIFVDGKEAGQSRLTLVEKSDGTTQVTGTAKVQVKLLGFTAFSYQVSSQEAWNGGKLVELKSVATEDGKTTKVDATRAGEQLQVRVNGGNLANMRGDVWTSSYWKLADAKYHNKPVPVLDADTGKLLNGDLAYVGTESIPIGAKTEDCYHFRVTGIPVPIELWFDRHHRLVRQEFTESGHRTLMQLIAIRR
jgi:hypothetical protein